MAGQGAGHGLGGVGPQSVFELSTSVNTNVTVPDGHASLAAGECSARLTAAS